MSCIFSLSSPIMWPKCCKPQIIRLSHISHGPFPLYPISLYKIDHGRTLGCVSCPQGEFLLDKKLMDPCAGPPADLGTGFKSPGIGSLLKETHMKWSRVTVHDNNWWVFYFIYFCLPINTSLPHLLHQERSRKTKKNSWNPRAKSWALQEPRLYNSLKLKGWRLTQGIQKLAHKLHSHTLKSRFGLSGIVLKMN